MLVYNDSHLDSTASLNAVLRGQKRTKLLHTSGTCPGDGKKIIKSIFYQSHVIALRSEGIWGLMTAWVTVGHLGVTAGHFRVIKGPLRVRN